MVIRGFVLLSALVSINLFSNNLEARTWPNPNYSKDPGANKNHVFATYKPVAGYEDPVYENALALSSPLADQRFESYDVALVIDVKNGKDAVTNAPIQGQTVRVYAREALLGKIPTSNIQNITYDTTTGLLFYWKTSTAKPGKITPRGYFRPQSFSSDHKSSIYNNAPMPWAVFFNGAIASHGTTANSQLGSIASAGCARLETQRAKDLFQLIGIAGKDWVDKIDTKGNLLYTTDGQIVQEENYKTLIVVQ